MDISQDAQLHFGSREMKSLHLVNNKGKLKEITSVINEDEDTLIIKFRKS